MNIVHLIVVKNSFYILESGRTIQKFSSFSLILGTKNLAEYWDSTGPCESGVGLSEVRFVAGVGLGIGLSSQNGLLRGGGETMSGKTSETKLELAKSGVAETKFWVQSSIGLNWLYLISGTTVDAVEGHSTYSMVGFGVSWASST